MNCGCLQTLLVCALATTVFSEDRPKIWHVVWTGGQSNSVGTNSQTSGYPTWPTSARIQNYVQSNSSFIPAVVPLQGEYNVGFSQVRTTSTHREIQEREERDRCKDRERERERETLSQCPIPIITPILPIAPPSDVRQSVVADDSTRSRHHPPQHWRRWDGLYRRALGRAWR